MPRIARSTLLERFRAKIESGKPLIGGGAGTGLSAKCEEAGGIDLIVIYNSGRYRMAGRGSLAGLLAYGNANEIVCEMAREVLPVVKHTPVLAGVNGTDPFMIADEFLGRLITLGFSGVQNFPTVGLIDGTFRANLEETGMGVQKEIDMIALAHRMDLFTIVYVATADEAKAMADVGADAIIAHVGTTVGGSIGVTGAVCSMDDAVRRTQAIIEGGRSSGRKDIFYLSHGGPIATPADATYVNENTDCVGFVGASSLERLGVEGPLVELTQRFKKIPAPAAKKR